MCWCELVITTLHDILFCGKRNIVIERDVLIEVAWVLEHNGNINFRYCADIIEVTRLLFDWHFRWIIGVFTAIHVAITNCVGGTKADAVTIVA
jgi:predicted nucleic-acid-binding protein